MKIIAADPRRFYPNILEGCDSDFSEIE